MARFQSPTINSQYDTLTAVRNTHVGKPQKRVCKCFICGDEKHLANRCSNKNKNIEKSNLIEQLGDYEIEEINSESDNESVYSICSEDENSTKITYTYMNNIDFECIHEWIRFRGNNHISYFRCKLFPAINRRYQCNKCFKEIYFLCIKILFNINTNLEGSVGHILPNNDIYKERVNKHELAIELMNQRLTQLEYQISQLEYKHNLLKHNISKNEKRKEPLIEEEYSNI